MWFVAFLNSIAVFELINIISTKLCKLGENGKPYGTSFFTMLQGISMYTSAWILNNIVKDRFEHYYIIGTILWITFSSLAVVTVDQITHRPQTVFAPGAFYADAKNVYLLASKLSSALGQYLAFVCGQVASFALAQYLPSENNLWWCLLAAIFQVLALLIEGARTTWLHTLFKAPVSTRLSLFASDAHAANHDQRQNAACCC